MPWPTEKLAGTIGAIKRVDAFGLVGMVTLVIVGWQLYRSNKWHEQALQAIDQNAAIERQVGAIGQMPAYPAFGDLQFPDLPAHATINERTIMLGIYKKIGLDAAARRDTENTDLKAENAKLRGASLKP